MATRRRVRWYAALGLWGGVVGASAQPSLTGAERSLVPQVHHYHAECHNPNIDLCTVQSPGTSLYTVLTPGIPFDDLITHWIVDLRQFAPTKGAVKTLRVASTSGEVHAIHMKLLYDKAALADVARKSAPASAQSPVMSGIGMPSTSAASDARVGAKSNVDLGQGAVAPAGERADRASGTLARSASTSGYVARAGQGDARSSPSGPSVAVSSKPQVKPTEASAPGQASPSNPRPAVTVQPPCLDGVCIGASIQTLNAPFEPVLTVGEQLRSGLTLYGTLPPNAEESFKRMEAMYRKGDEAGLEKEAMSWPTSFNSGRDQLLKNLFHLVQAYKLAEQALGGKRNADTVALAMYFVPQPVNRKEGFRRTVNIKANPMGFATGSNLNFDLGLPKLMAKAKPVFCEAFRHEGYYESKSGYPTTVSVQSDSDGDFKVVSMQRIFQNSSRDSLQQLHGELAQRYASAIEAGIAKLEMKMLRVELRFMHPIMIQGVGTGADEASKLFQAHWQQGWLDFKGKNLGLLGAMKTVADNNKNSVPTCKPKVLTLN